MAAAFQKQYDASEEAGWSTPDMAILDAGRVDPPVLPREMFGPQWQLVLDLAAGAGCPVDYPAMSLIACSSSIIGASRRIQPFDTADQWREPCILWFGCVGDPSSNKSPGLEKPADILGDIERDYANDHKIALMNYETRAERAKAERERWKDAVKAATKDGYPTPPMPDAAVMPEEPVRKRLVVKDTTPEALAEILAGNANGLMHYRDELSGWLMGFDRYTTGGREFWLEAYGGRKYVVDRKSLKAPLQIPFNGVTVLGGIQPEKLHECLFSTPDDGLVARFLWAWPNPIPFRRPQNIADLGVLEAVFRRLQSLRIDYDDYGDPKPIVLPLVADASDVFEAWLADQTATVQEAASLYKGFCGKLRGMALRLALVVELIAWASEFNEPEPETVSVKSLVAAIEFLENYAKPMALRVFGDAALPVAERDAALLARHILRQRCETINLRELKRSGGMPTLKKPGAIEAAAEHLAEAGWLKPLKEPGGVGRPSKDFVINPAIHGASNG